MVRRAGGADPDRRSQVRLACKHRELERLAARAKISLAEAQAHRDAGERYCPVHGWFVTVRCVPCKNQKH
jgi:hypothetical protein